MSRIGKLPVTVPPKVKVDFTDGVLSVTGPKGSLSREIPDALELEISGEEIGVKRKDESRRSRSLHGLFRSLVANMVEGVTEGFKKVLVIHGVGYRADTIEKGRYLWFTLGHSHPIMYELPEGVAANVEQSTRITLEGVDKELVGQTAATIRAFRPPEPYKGKGIRYENEVIRTKVGKAGVA
jgi:large subunit ribosomal protein L6